MTNKGPWRKAWIGLDCTALSGCLWPSDVSQFVHVDVVLIMTTAKSAVPLAQIGRHPFDRRKAVCHLDQDPLFLPGQRNYLAHRSL